MGCTRVRSRKHNHPYISPLSSQQVLAYAELVLQLTSFFTSSAPNPSNPQDKLSQIKYAIWTGGKRMVKTTTVLFSLLQRYSASYSALRGQPPNNLVVGELTNMIK